MCNAFHASNLVESLKYYEELLSERFKGALSQFDMAVLHLNMGASLLGYGDDNEGLLHYNLSKSLAVGLTDNEAILNIRKLIIAAYYNKNNDFKKCVAILGEPFEFPEGGVESWKKAVFIEDRFYRMTAFAERYINKK